MTFTRDEQLKREYHSYCCKLVQLFEEGTPVKILGYGEWLKQRVDPERPENCEGK